MQIYLFTYLPGFMGVKRRTEVLYSAHLLVLTNMSHLASVRLLYIWYFLSYKVKKAIYTHIYGFVSIYYLPFFSNLSYFALKDEVLVADTSSSVRLFHFSITLLEKKNFLTSRFILVLAIFLLWPRRL